MSADEAAWTMIEEEERVEDVLLWGWGLDAAWRCGARDRGIYGVWRVRREEFWVSWRRINRIKQTLEMIMFFSSPT